MNKPLDPRNPGDRQALDEINRVKGTGAQQPPPTPPLPPKPEEPVATQPKAPAKPPAQLRSRYINLKRFKQQIAAFGQVELEMKLGSTESDDLLGLWNMLKAIVSDLETGNQCLIIAAKMPAAKPVEEKGKKEGS